MIIVFFNQSSLFLSARSLPEADNNIHFSELHDFSDDKPRLSEPDSLSNGILLQDLMKELFYSPQGKTTCLWGTDEDTLINLLKNKMHWLYAAGGLCLNGKNEMLFIFRNGKWDLPKGKPEGPEMHEETALREVEEECGVNRLSIIKPLSDTWHVYVAVNGAFVLKQSIWFLMDCRDTGKLVPQTEEGISEVRWVQRPLSDEFINHAFPSIRGLLEKEGFVY